MYCENVREKIVVLRCCYLFYVKSLCMPADRLSGFVLVFKFKFKSYFSVLQVKLTASNSNLYYCSS